MKTIHKFPAPKPGGVVGHYIPEGAKFLHCAVQDGYPMLWFEVDTSKPNLWRDFVSYGTGMDIYDQYTYVATYTMDGYEFVWHVYEVTI